MGAPVVKSTNGYALPVTVVASGGLPVSLADNGFGTPVIEVAAGGLPVTYDQGGGALDRTKHVYVGAGQSLMSYPFKRPSNPKVSAYWGKFLQSELLIAGSTTFGTYGAAAPFVSHNGANQNATDWTVRVQQASSQGSNFIDVAAVSGITDASEYTGLTNYWVNTQDNTAATGNAADTANSPGPLWRNCISILQAQPRVDSFGWSQGEADASWVGAASGNEVTYKTWLKAFFAAIRAAIGRPDLPIVIHRIGRTDNTSANSIKGTAAIRRIQAEIATEMDGVVFIEQYGELYANAALVAACTYTNGSQTITTTNTAGLSANASLASQVAGPGIQAGSKVTAINTGVSFTIDKPVQSDQSNVTIARMDPVHLYPGATTASQPFDTDTDGNSSLDYYDTTKGFFQVGRMLARALAKAFKVPDALSHQGPLAGTIAATTGQNTIDVTFTHRAGSDLQTRDGRAIGASSFGFRVVNNGADMTVNGISKISATVLRLQTTANVQAGTLSVDVGYGNMPYADVGAALCDNSPLKLPLEAIGPTRAPGLAIAV